MKPQNFDLLLDSCDTLMLDMDGTLLDLAYDNYMWLEHIPTVYAQKNDLSEAAAKEKLYGIMKKIQGEWIWYSLDHWSEVLDLDVASLHLDEQHRIGYLPGAKGFLEAVAAHDINVLMVTNSHQHTLDIKAAVTGITDYFDGIYTSHELGYAKEDQPFWHALQDQVDFDCAKTVFIDDNAMVLQSARDYGVGNLLHITNPDTGRPAKQNDSFTGIAGVSDLVV
jgi:putative hydrolase of the HAD superfamily